jgi:hypothetical protein
MLISVCFQQLYNIADSIIAGKFLGGDAIASIGISYTITMIYMAIANGSNIGCCVVISQFFGSKNYNRMKTCITTSIFSIIALSAILTISGIALSKPVLNLLNTPSDLFVDSISYLNIYTAGLIFLFLYNISTGIFTALATCHTILNAIGLTQAPDKPPVTVDNLGLLFSASIAIPRSVLINDTESAPDASAANAKSAMLVTLGESFTIRCLSYTFLTALTTCSMPVVVTPNAMPPCFTLGHETLSSIAGIFSKALTFSATAQ